MDTFVKMRHYISNNIIEQKYINSLVLVHDRKINELFDRLEALDFIRINRTAGLDVIYKTKEITALEAIEEYYKNKR